MKKATNARSQNRVSKVKRKKEEAYCKGTETYPEGAGANRIETKSKNETAAAVDSARPF